MLQIMLDYYFVKFVRYYSKHDLSTSPAPHETRTLTQRHAKRIHSTANLALNCIAGLHTVVVKVDEVRADIEAAVRGAFCIYGRFCEVICFHHSWVVG